MQIMKIILFFYQSKNVNYLEKVMIIKESWNIINIGAIGKCLINLIQKTKETIM